jgi:hypothetical protein
MADTTEYLPNLSHALRVKAEWLDKNEIPKLKDEFNAYRTSFAFLYNLYLKNGLIKEDPYKNDTQVTEVDIPDASPYKDENKLEELTKRLAAYDNQLNFIANGLQPTADTLTLDRIRRITGLLKYIDWVHLAGEDQGPVTKAVSKMCGDMIGGNDPMTVKIATESMANLNKTFHPLMVSLKTFTDYQREAYKLDLRDVTDQMAPGEASNIELIKKKFVQLKPDGHFYQELAEEVIHEDFGKDGADLKAKVLKKLQIPEAKVQAPKATVKGSLIEGAQILGNMSRTFSHIADIMDGNQVILDNRKKSFIQKLKEIFGKSQEAVIYEVKYIDPVRGAPVYEKVNFYAFRADLDKMIHKLAPLMPHGSALGKLEAAQEEQIVGLLEKDMREIQAMHKILSGLDEYFKTHVDPKDRDKIRGIRPDLETIRLSIQRANNKRHEFDGAGDGAHKDEHAHPDAAQTNHH